MARNYRKLNEALSRRSLNKSQETSKALEGVVLDMQTALYSKLSAIFHAIEQSLSSLHQGETVLNIDTGPSDTLIPQKLEELAKLIESSSDKEIASLHEIAIKNFPLSEQIVFPKTQQIEGEVTISNPPDMSPLNIIAEKLDELKTAINEIKIPEPKEIKFPEIKIPQPDTRQTRENTSKVIIALESLKQSIDHLPAQIHIPSVPNFPSSINVGNFPPQKYPMPVTHIDINPLQGYMKSTAVTVGTSATALPTTPLAYRRSMSVYNNSSSVTLYIGGSDVTVANGVPILPSTSESFDAGGKLIVYGITSSTADVRVLEVSDDEYTRGTPNV